MHGETAPLSVHIEKPGMGPSQPRRSCCSRSIRVVLALCTILVGIALLHVNSIINKAAGLYPAGEPFYKPHIETSMGSIGTVLAAYAGLYALDGVLGVAAALNDRLLHAQCAVLVVRLVMSVWSTAAVATYVLGERGALLMHDLRESAKQHWETYQSTIPAGEGDCPTFTVDCWDLGAAESAHTAVPLLLALGLVLVIVSGLEISLDAHVVGGEAVVTIASKLLNALLLLKGLALVACAAAAWLKYDVLRQTPEGKAGLSMALAVGSGMAALALGGCLISSDGCRRRTCWRFKWRYCKCCSLVGHCCRAALSCVEWLSLILHSLTALALLGLSIACYFYGDSFSAVIATAADKVPCDPAAASEVIGRSVSAGTVCATIASPEDDLDPVDLGGCTSYCDAHTASAFVRGNVLRLAAAFSLACCFRIAHVVTICLLMYDGSHRSAVGHLPLEASEEDSHLNGVTTTMTTTTPERPSDPEAGAGGVGDKFGWPEDEEVDMTPLRGGVM